MNAWVLPWVKLAGAWVTAVVLCLAAMVFLVWQTSGPMGRAGQIDRQTEDLSTEIEGLEKMVTLAAEERLVVAETGAEIDRISGEVFGRLEDRLTSVLRDVGVISRDAGLIPNSFGYVVQREEKTGGVRFGIGFSVDGTYPQVRQLLTGLQASPQFLIIDSISFKGEEDARSQNLGIGLQVSTYLAEAEPEALRVLIDLLEIDEVVMEEPLVAAEVFPQEGTATSDTQPTEAMSDEDVSAVQASPEAAAEEIP